MRERSLRILMCNAFHYERGGSEVYTFALSRELERRGHEVIPFSMSDERNHPSAYEEFFVSNADFSELPRGLDSARNLRTAGRVLYSLEAKRKVLRLIERTSPGIAHVHNIAHHLSPSILSGIRSQGLPIVQTLHDYKLVCPNSLLFCRGRVCERCRRRRYYQAVIQRCKRDSLMASALAAIELYSHKLMGIYENNVDVFIAPSEFLRHTMIRFGIQPGKIVHIPQFIDVEAYTPRYDHEDYFLYFGRLSSEKGVRVLVNATKKLAGAKMFVAGEGPLRQQLERLAGDTDSIRFLGYVRRDGLKELVRNSMFVVVPSECYENAPMSVYEAFALGKPVIGSRIGGIPELIEPDSDGLLFEPGDADDLADKMRHLLEHKSVIRQMGKAARDKVEKKYSAVVHLEAVMNLYQGFARSPMPSASR